MIKMNQRKLGSLFILLMLLSPMLVRADTLNTETPTGLVSPDSEYSVYWDESGTRWDNYIGTPIIRTGYQQDTWGAVLFPNISIPKDSLIDSANLSLYFTYAFDPIATPLTISIWGIRHTFKDFDGNQQTLSVVDRSAPLGAYATNVDLKDLNSSQYVVIDVTDQVQEIITMYDWEENDSLGFMVLGAYQPVSRTYQSNVGLYVPQLNITFDEYQGYPDNVVDVYQNYTITQDSSLNSSSMIIVDRSDKTELAVLDTSNPSNMSWNYYDLNNSNVENYRTGNDQGVVIGDYVYLMLQKSGLKFYRMELDNLSSGLTKIGDLELVDNRADYVSVYHPELKELHLIWLLNNGDVEESIYFPENSTLTNSTVIHNGWGTNGRSLDAKYSPIHRKILLMYSTSDTGGSAVHKRYRDYNGSWNNYMEWTDFDVVYSSVSAFQNTSTMYTFGAGFPTFQWGYRANTNNGTSWSGTHNNGGFDITEEYFLGFENTFASYYIYMDYNPDEFVALEFENGSTTATNLDAGFPTSRYEPAGGEPADMVISLTFNGSRSIMGITLQGTAYLFHDVWTSSDNYGFNGSSITDWASVDGSRTNATSTFTVIPPEGGDPPNEDCLSQATTIEEVRACIDLVAPVQSDDPNPPGWDETGAFTRAKMRYYFFLIGWGCIWVPLWYLAYVPKGLDKIMSFWIVLVFILFGLGILWSIPHI